MRKLVSLLLVLICVMDLTACANDNEDILHLGVNAVIIEIDTDKQQITVKGTDKDSMLGENCVISCKDIDLIYCNYDSHEGKQITMQDLHVGDDILLEIKESEIKDFKDSNETLNIEQLQLGTQRLN